MTTVLPQKQEQHGGGTYTFSSRPRAVQQRKKYRDAGQGQDATSLYGNIMYDRRIVRGNTYAQHTLPASAQPDPIDIQRQQEARRRAIARKRAKEQLRPRSPEAVEGRKHIDVQTELYLEELTDRVEEADVETQTDTFLDRPPSPLFIPAKTGKDVATQIYEGDLFDFDMEVKPILEVLVGKTIEQALLEVMEEEELENLRAQQREFEELRNAELVETQRLEEQERRHREEKERRMKQQREVLRKEKETAEKIAARAFAQSYLADLIPSVFGTLADNGYFFDPVERDVESGFMPWLMETVEKAIDKSVMGRTMVDVLIREVVAQRMESFEALQRSIQEMSGGAAPTVSQTVVEAPAFIAEAAIPEVTPAEAPPAEEAPPTEGEGEGEQAEEPEGGEDEGEQAEEGGDDAPGEA
ncbi:radial spoke head protein 3 homolog B-like isoform X2 [Branchiostoma lanceolatum]|uniref:radial spoke head protein 3 homolog B-like isoform X2 n=1 Tax=Branchiostoma lanceolatum TaxID=7740 RepID=UPI0034536D25